LYWYWYLRVLYLASIYILNDNSLVIEEINRLFHVEEQTGAPENNQGVTETPKKTKLFANYAPAKSGSTTVKSCSLNMQLNKYIDMLDDSDDDCLSFWKSNRAMFDKPFYAAARSLKCTSIK
jgi:hypothetical protein